MPRPEIRSTDGVRRHRLSERVATQTSVHVKPCGLSLYTVVDECVTSQASWVR